MAAAPRRAAVLWAEHDAQRLRLDSARTGREPDWLTVRIVGVTAASRRTSRPRRTWGAVTVLVAGVRFSPKSGQGLCGLLGRVE
jgi:hypothetical protein